MNTLKKALIGNAIFSSLSATILLLFPTTIADLFQIENKLPFLIVGVGLLFFVGIILYETKQLRTKGVYYIIIQDLLWVIGSILLLIIQPFGISSIGNILIAIVALIVLFFAIWQYQGLKKI